VPIRVGLLLERVAAVIHRLDVAGTRSFDPPGPKSSGYSSAFREPVVFDDAATGARTSARRELAPVRVPCQVESRTFEQLRQELGGDVPSSALVLVTHRKDLDALGLIDATSRAVSISVGDRVSAIERYGQPGSVVRPITAPGLYVFHVLPASWGFGPDGHDLELIFLQERALGVR
jgi:hypothetical protein